MAALRAAVARAAAIATPATMLPGVVVRRCTPAYVATSRAPSAPVCRAAMRASTAAGGTRGRQRHTRRGGRFLWTLLPGALVGFYHGYRDVRTTDAFWWLSSVPGVWALHRMDPEAAHAAAIKAATLGLAPIDDGHDLRGAAASASSLKARVWGLDFPSAVGLAAGFDKHAEAPLELLRMGFGSVEIGTVTPLAQDGNPKPRVFRLTEDDAVVNRYGFNSQGLEPAVERLRAVRATCPLQRESGSGSGRGRGSGGIIGINIGKNKLGHAVNDFVTCARHTAPLADYLVVNVSSPNTPGLRALQRIEPLRELLQAVQAAATESAAAAGKPAPPVVVKIAPDVSDDQLKDIATVVTQCGIDGVIVSNTTIARPDTLRSKHKGETGGLSGAPLTDASTEVLSRLYVLLGGKVPLVGVGGVGSGEDAYRKVRAGASLVQLYSSMAYQGPEVVRRVKRELAACLARDGFASVADAVGADHRK